MNKTDPEAVALTRRRLCDRLLAELEDDGHWEGELATSALSTATAVVALHLAGGEAHRDLVEGGLRWLSDHANEDGGWGDTVISLSNISTTSLCWAAFNLWPEENAAFAKAEADAATWLRSKAGSTEPDELAKAIMARYGEDHTFSVPILTMLALCGRLGEDGWRLVTPLPFELAAAPHRIYHLLRLPVVSYAMPALIAIGQCIFHHRGAGNAVSTRLRKWTAARTLRTLERLQPQNGGFLEAVPLTSFVTMSLASMNLRQHPVVTKGVAFLKQLVREDGSWPIDTHLATWVTSLSVAALARDDHPCLSVDQKNQIADWLLAQQYTRTHPFTHAAPGGWAWTPLPGGVPDADDTSGALLALAELAPERARDAAQPGLNWLIQLQNRDGGMPTFCRGWGTLPFDKSCADITAHALTALIRWRGLGVWDPAWERNLQRMLSYLKAQQRRDGSWVPLWFGNQHAPADENPTYGTARVLLGLQSAWDGMNVYERSRAAQLITRGRAWLVDSAHDDGGWGGAPDVAASIEESALAIEALATVPGDELSDDEREVVRAGLTWLVTATNHGEQTPPSAIGFYFANLWYYERLYPHIFATAAFNAAS